MKKHGVFAVCILALFCASAALAAPGEKQIKAMSLFLSNFTELGFMEASSEEMAKPENYPDLVRFGIGHNYINNFKSRIERNNAKSQEHGDVRIKAHWVEESVLKYFGLKITANRSVDQSRRTSSTRRKKPSTSGPPTARRRGTPGSSVRRARKRACGTCPGRSTTRTIQRSFGAISRP